MRRKVLIVLLYTLSSNAYGDDIQSTARDLGKYYFKGSELERRLDATYKSLPIEFRTTLGYFAPLGQMFAEQRITFIWSF